ncbi:MAG TPA: CrcB family protein [Pseudolysinimonas sp.]|nr:CrcB family protein [Pseudolysinimonas sp.]
MTAWVVAAAVVAGALGAVARYGVTRAVARRLPSAQLPRAVLFVNVAGSVIAGVLLALPGDLQYILVAGFAGGLTTFSTWSVETIQQAMGGRSQAAVGNVVINLAAGLIGAVLAYAITVGILVSTGGTALGG